MKEKEVVYIAELDADVDDVLAAEYLHRKGVLKEVVCDPLPKTAEGKERKRQLEEIGVKVSYKMPPTAKYVFVGGALTELSRYLINYRTKYLVMNGGFVGCNIVENPLEKFKGKMTVRTFNFNCDVTAWLRCPASRRGLKCYAATMLLIWTSRYDGIRNRCGSTMKNIRKKWFALTGRKTNTVMLFMRTSIKRFRMMWAMG